MRHLNRRCSGTPSSTRTEWQLGILGSMKSGCESGQPSRARKCECEAEDKVHMSAGGVAGNGGSPAGRINAALEKMPHFREAEINSNRGY